MNPVLQTGPLLEPVTLAEAKAHLRVDHSDDDTYINGLISAARTYLEAYLGLALISRTYVWKISRWPLRKTHGADQQARSINVPIGPLQGVVSITLFDRDDSPVVWSSDHYYVAKSLDQIFRKEGKSWPTPERFPEGIEITYSAGFGDVGADVPMVIRQAILQLVAHFYQARLPVSQAPLYPIPFGVMELLAPYRKRRLL